jgi:hypothetical protein
LFSFRFLLLCFVFSLGDGDGDGDGEEEKMNFLRGSFLICICLLFFFDELNCLILIFPGTKGEWH